MKNLSKSKTLTATLSSNLAALQERISDPNRLAQWHGAAWGGLSRQGAVQVRFVRDDRAGVLDIYWMTASGSECLEAIRLLPNGSSSELVMTILQSDGVSDNDFQLHVRWAEKAVQELRKQGETLTKSPPAAEPIDGVVPFPPEPERIDAAQLSEAGSNGFNGKRLYIGNLPFDWTDDQLRQHFAEAGTVAVAEVARYGRGGRSRGFGFIEMATEEECRTAVEKLHGSLAGSRKIVVRASRPKENRPTAEGAEPKEIPSPIKRTPEPAPVRLVDSKPSELAAVPAARGIRGRLRDLGNRLTRRQEREKQAGVIATGEYEFFPRGQKVEPSTEANDNSGNRRSVIDPSPYMEDTGDVENRGSRQPRRRPPPRRTRRPSRG